MIALFAVASACGSGPGDRTASEIAASTSVAGSATNPLTIESFKIDFDLDSLPPLNPADVHLWDFCSLNAVAIGTSILSLEMSSGVRTAVAGVVTERDFVPSAETIRKPRQPLEQVHATIVGVDTLRDDEISVEEPKDEVNIPIITEPQRELTEQSTASTTVNAVALLRTLHSVQGAITVWHTFAIYETDGDRIVSFRGPCGETMLSELEELAAGRGSAVTVDLLSEIITRGDIGDVPTEPTISQSVVDAESYLSEWSAIPVGNRSLIAGELPYQLLSEVRVGMMYVTSSIVDRSKVIMVHSDAGVSYDAIADINGIVPVVFPLNARIEVSLATIGDGGRPVDPISLGSFGAEDLVGEFFTLEVTADTAQLRSVEAKVIAELSGQTTYGLRKSIEAYEEILPRYPDPAIASEYLDRWEATAPTSRFLTVGSVPIEWAPKVRLAGLVVSSELSDADAMVVRILSDIGIVYEGSAGSQGPGPVLIPLTGALLVEFADLDMQAQIGQSETVAEIATDQGEDFLKLHVDASGARIEWISQDAFLAETGLDEKELEALRKDFESVAFVETPS